MAKSFPLRAVVTSVLICAATLGVVVASVVLAVDLQAGAPTESSTRNSPPVINVSALGHLEPATRVRKIAPKSPKPGVTVQELYVSPGSTVEENQVLAILDDRASHLAAVALAEAEVANAKTRLEQVLAGPKDEDVAAKELENQLLATARDHSERLWERSRRLAQSRAFSEENLEVRRWNYDKAALEHSRAVEELRSLERVRSVDVAVAEAELAVAKATHEQARAELALTEIRSPMEGTVLAINTWPGERVTDEGLLELGDVSQMQAVAEVYEGDLPRVAIGQRATVRIPSSDLEVVGTVAELGQRVARKDILSNDPVSDTDARVIEVRINVASDDLEPHARNVLKRLSNARVEITIETASARAPSRTGGA